MQSRHQLTVQRDRLVKAKSKLQDAVREIEYELEDNSKALKELQANCVHVEEWYGEGRHGSDKGTHYYRCKICDFHWDDG
jgi:DNA-directed RNA polymerase subunit M/transcription elongation factor TFIIS